MLADKIVKHSVDRIELDTRLIGGNHSIEFDGKNVDKGAVLADDLVKLLRDFEKQVIRENFGKEPGKEPEEDLEAFSWRCT